MLKKIFILLLLLGFTLISLGNYDPAHAQDNPQPNTSAENTAIATKADQPVDAMFDFLKAMPALKKDNRDQEALATVYQRLNLAADVEVDTALSQAALLWDTLDRIRNIQRDEFLPLSSNQNHYIYFPRPLSDDDRKLSELLNLTSDQQIAFSRQSNGTWTFADHTLQKLSEINSTIHKANRDKQVSNSDHSSIQHFIEEKMPESFRQQVWIGVAAWKWILLLCLIFAGVVLDQIGRMVLSAFGTSLLGRLGKEANRKDMARSMRPFSMALAGLLWMATLPLTAFPEFGLQLLHAAASVFTVLSITWSIWRILDLIGRLLLRKAAKTENKFDDVLVPLIIKSLKVIVFCAGVIYGAQALRINIVPLLTGLGIGSLAFAFAAKDTVENFFGSIAVILDHPFEVGDWVVIDGKTEGTVEELGFRSTRIRTFYNSQITVPNATLVRATVDNYGRRQYRRWKTTLGVQYDTSPDKLVAFTEGVRELVRQHPYTRKDYYQVWCNEFGPHSLDILLYIFFETPDWSTELRERERFFIDVVRLADILGVQFAFPTQTIHLHQETSAEPQRAYNTPESLSEKRAAVQGLHAAREIIQNQTWTQNKPGAVQFDKLGTDLTLDEAGNHTKE